MKRILVVVLVIVGIAVVAGLGLLMAGVSFAVGVAVVAVLGLVDRVSRSSPVCREG